MNNPKKVSINLLSEDAVQTYQVGDNKDVIMVIYVSMAKREDLRCQALLKLQQIMMLYCKKRQS